MGIELPAAVTSLPSWILGGEWPDGDETKVWQLSEQWYRTGTSIQEQARAADAIVQALLGQYEGPAAQALNAFWSKHLEAIVEVGMACDELAAYCDDTAMQIEYTKLAIIANLLILVATIAALLAAACATFGTAAACIPVAQQATALVVRELIKQLVLAILRGMAIGVGMSAGVDLIIQFAQMKLGHRDGINLAQTGQAAVKGAISGALGGAAGFGAGRVTVSGAAGVVGVNAAAGAGGGAAGNFVSTLATGGSFDDAVTAAANGGLTGGIQGASSGLNAAVSQSTARAQQTDDPIDVVPGQDWNDIYNRSGNSGIRTPEGAVFRPSEPRVYPTHPTATSLGNITDYLTGTNLPDAAPAPSPEAPDATQEEVDDWLRSPR